MLTLRKSAERGHVQHGWLDTFHTFSFGDYFDADHHHFRALRVINDDRIAAGQGFGTHPHRDMEIFTTMLAGQLQHRDSMGNGSVIKAGEWQMMSAGTGVQHSEFNPSPTDAAHLLQIWIVPDKKGYAPRYDQKSFADKPTGDWALIASPDGRDGSLGVRQDVRILAAKILPNQTVTHGFAPGRAGWLHVATGSVTVDGQRLEAGDAVAIEDQDSVEVAGIADAELILFDLGRSDA